MPRLATFTYRVHARAWRGACGIGGDAMHTRHSQPLSLLSAHSLHALSRNWWLLLLRGIVSILFGVAAFAWPRLTVLALALLYGAYALADGILSLGAAVGGGSERTTPAWWLVLVGVLGIAAGIIAFLWPGITAFALVMLIGAWALAIGVFEIIGAIRLRHEINNEWWLIAAGVLSALFGLAVLMSPGTGALAIVWAIAAYAILAGILKIAFSFRLKGLHDRTGTAARG
jgi:uncharacterized membrane protein HdeD (DUF308 family)